jgi:hypothetical protein
VILVYKMYTTVDECIEQLVDVGTDLNTILTKISKNRDNKSLYLFYRTGNLVKPFMYIEPLEE